MYSVVLFLFLKSFVSINISVANINPAFYFLQISSFEFVYVTTPFPFS